MERTIRKYGSFDEMKADEYRYWQSRPAHERLDAVEELVRAAYASKDGRWSRMFQDHKDLLSAFHAHGVKYLIVGGYAVIFYAQPRATKDIDLLIKADAANAQAAYEALAQFGVPLRDIRPEDLAASQGILSFRDGPEYSRHSARDSRS